MNTYQRLVLKMLACILRRLISGDAPGRMQYEALVLTQVDDAIEAAEAAKE